jgi:hypothetical protein
MQEQLTKKQQAARAYYARNAEKIRAQKRAKYTKTTKARPKATPKAKKQPVHCITQAVKNLKMQARRKIEDMQLAKELGISVSEL